MPAEKSSAMALSEHWIRDLSLVGKTWGQPDWLPEELHSQEVGQQTDAMRFPGPIIFIVIQWI